MHGKDYSMCFKYMSRIEYIKKIFICLENSNYVRYRVHHEIRHRIHQLLLFGVQKYQ